MFFIRIEQEYKALIGEAIPFRKLGFQNVEDFIRDIPETVLIDESTRYLLFFCANYQLETD